MGLLVDGQWQDQWYDTKSTGGRFKRDISRFRNWITPDGSAGATGQGGFEAASDRYHLYVGLACPWAHRTLIFRALKGLESFLPVSVVHWYMAENGWTFEPGDGVVADRLRNEAAESRPEFSEALHRRLVEVPVRSLGATPLQHVDLPRGSENEITGGVTLIRLTPDEVRADDGVQLGLWGGQTDADRAE